MSTPADTPTTAGPTKAEIHVNATELVRSCLARFGQSADDAVVQRQAEKIVQRTWPTIKRAWQQ